MRDHK